MYYEVCYHRFAGKIIQSPYENGYQMSREEFSVGCHSTNPYHWTTNRWVFERLIWCKENNLKLAGFDTQAYIKSYEGHEYKPIRGSLITVLEFRFIRKSDALFFKLKWS
jgi:hypothetical protein